MEGEFIKTEKLTETPTSILGNDLYQALKVLLPSQLNMPSLNHSCLYKTPDQGCLINFNNIDGSELSAGDWLLVQEVARVIFTTAKNNFQDKPEFESLKLTFIDKDELGKRTMVVKRQLQ